MDLYVYQMLTFSSDANLYVYYRPCVSPVRKWFWQHILYLDFSIVLFWCAPPQPVQAQAILILRRKLLIVNGVIFEDS